MSAKTINPNNAPATVLIKKTSAKATPPSGGERFNNALLSAGGNLLNGVETAASFLPGGGALSAAIRGSGATTMGTTGSASYASTGLGGSADGMTLAKSGNNYGYQNTSVASGNTMVKSGNDLGYQDGTTVSGTSGNPEGDLATNAANLLAQQIRVQNISNTFTARSNIMKSDHETRRGVIRNMA